MDSLFSDLFGSAQLSATLVVPVVVVILSAVLVFLCGVRKPKEPQFRKIAASVESSSKKTRRKEKQPTSSTKSSSLNGNLKSSASTAVDKKTTSAASKKESQQPQVTPKRKEPSAPKKPAAHPVAKKEKTPKPEKVRKPADFDDSGWTTVQSRTDKKKKQEDLLLSQVLDSALSQSKKSTGSKADAKTTKNVKQLKDQVNKSKKEAAEINRKNKKNAADNIHNEQVNNKVVDTIEHLVNELKKNDSNEIIVRKEHIDQAADIAVEKSDDSKPVSGGGVIFDEMADTWTEAKTPKKGKKKARKE